MRSYWFLFIVSLFLGSCQSKPVRRQESAPASSSDIRLDHKYFLISYNPEHRLPNWVSYQLSAVNLRKGIAQRRDKFFADPLLSAKNITQAKPTDFDGRTYDRGHMAPSEDFIWSQAANDSTFVMSNMVPQTRKLNRGSWKTLENKIRKWACAEEELHIITGPLLSKNLPRFPSQVSVPQKFFKIVYDLTPPHKAIAFVYSQEDARIPPSERAMNVIDVEKLTGQTFLENLPSEEAQRIKSHHKTSDWNEKDCVRKNVDN